MTDDLSFVFDTVVEPARGEFLDAETKLVRAVQGGDLTQLAEARLLVLRRARTAAIELHHFVDQVALVRPPWARFDQPGDPSRWLQSEHCRMLRGEPVKDVDALTDIANAFKHAKLEEPKRHRSWIVEDQRAVITTSSGYGMMGCGEGNYGGEEQVIVRRLDGTTRALSAILQNVRDAWMAAMGRNLGEIGPR